MCTNTEKDFTAFFSLLLWYPMIMGKILRWRVQRRISSRNRNTSEKYQPQSTEGNWATRIYLPLWIFTIHKKEKAGKQKKKQGKAKGVTNQYFIQTAPWIKILCIDRSEVQFTYNCHLEKRQTSLKTEEYVFLNYFSSTFYILWLFQGSVLHVILIYVQNQMI